MPAPARSVARTAQPGEFVGSQTTWSGMAVTTTGSTTAPAAVPTCTRPPSRTPTCGRGGGGQPGDGALGGAGEERLAVLQPAGVEHGVPGGQDRLARARRRPARRQARAGRARARRPTPPSASTSACTAARRTQPERRRRGRPRARRAPGGRPSRSTRAPAANGRGRPSQLRNVPGLLDRRRDGQHDVGALGHRRAAHLERDDEPRPRRARRRASGRVGQVGQVDAADERARRARRPRPPRRICPCVAARGVRQLVDAPGRGDLDPRADVGHRAAAGQQDGQGTRLDAAPARRHGAGSTRAGRPVRRGEPQRGGQRRRGLPASRSPTRTTAPGPASAAAASRSRGGRGPCGDAARRAPRPRCRGRPARACRAGARRPGGERRDRADAVPPGEHALAQPQERDPGLLLGLQADEQDERAPSPGRRT